MLAVSVAVLLAFGLAAYLLWLPARGTDATDSRSVAALPAGESQNPELEPPEAQSVGKRTEPQMARPRGEAAAPASKQHVEGRLRIPHDVVMQTYKNDLWEQVQENPPELRWPGDPDVDADMAYRLYMYYGNCSVLRSRGQHINKQIDKIADKAETAEGRSLARLEGRLDRIIDYYELCMPIPPDVDARLEAVIWMSEAVRLGHEVAEVQFYEKAMGFLLRPDDNSSEPPLVMKRPDLVADFKATARQGLARGIEQGHPEAYMARSSAVLEGLIYPRDPVLAYAYALVAGREAAKNRIVLKDLAQTRQSAARLLDEAQRAEAEQLAMELKTP